MADTPFPLPRELRESAILDGDGTAGPFGPSAYKVFDTLDVTVFARAAGEIAFSDVTASVAVTKTADLPFDTFSITFPEAVPETTQWFHQARRTAERSLAVTRAGSINATALEKELSKQATTASELRRDVDRSIRFSDPTISPVIQAKANEFLGIDITGTKIEGKGTPGELGAGDLLAANALAELAGKEDEARTNIKAVGYAEQTLAAAAKAQARENIAALSYEAQTLAAAAIMQAQANIGAVTFDTVADLLADTILANAAAAGKVHLAAGKRVQAGGFAYEVAAAAASDHHVETAGGVKLYVLRVTNRLFLDAFGAVADDEDAAATNKTILATALAAAASTRGSKIVEAGPHTYYFADETNLAADGVTLQSSVGAIFKRAATTANKSGLLIQSAEDYKLVGIELDGNRDNTPNVDGDHCLLIVFDTKNVTIRDCKAHASKGKGIGVASGVSGIGAIDVHVIDCEAWDCGAQALMSDRSNGTGDDTIPCLRPIFERCKVLDTDHAGIAINDGTLGARVIDCTLDTNNSVWATIEVRGSRNTLVRGCIGRRGLHGFRALTLDANAVSRGEICDGLTLEGNIWEFNKSEGCSIVGSQDWTVTGDISRNNGQAGGTHYGFIAIEKASLRGADNGRLIGVQSYDDQDTATQAVGIAVLSSDNVKVVAPRLWGNTTHNKVQYNSLATGLEVIGDGPDGATKKRASASTGEIAAAGSAEVDVSFTTAFIIAPNHAVASVLSATPGLVVDNIVSLSTTKAVVRVSNASEGALTGTVYVTAELFT